MTHDAGLRKIFRDHLKGFDLLAVETGRTASGVPDLNYCKRGVEGWVEMKRAVGDRCTIRPAQVSWIEHRIDHGGRVFVAVHETGNLKLFYGLSIRQLVDQRVSRVAHIAQWSGSPAKWDWASIEQILLRWKPFVSA